MTVPLIILAVLSALGGFLGMPSFLGTHYLKGFLSPAFSFNRRIVEFEAPLNLELTIIVLTIIVVISGWFLAKRKYVDKDVPMATDESKLPFWYKLSLHKFYVDELFDAVVVKPLFALSTFLHDYIEKPVIDGLINGMASGTGLFGAQLRKIQNGRIGFYVLMMVIGVVVILIYSLVQMKVF
jgi:NADH-quinone oxidoreductase subunit L